jgi:hypothetical protein
MDLSARWSNLPGPVRWILGLTAFVVGYGIVYASIAEIAPSSWGDGRIRIAIAGLCVPLFLVGVLQGRSRLGGRGQLRLYRHALRTGQVPDDAKTERWLPLVRKQERYLREGRVFFRVLNGVALALLVVAGVLLAVFEPRAGAVVLVVGVASAPVLWWTDRLWGRRSVQVSKVRAELERQAHSSGLA